MKLTKVERAMLANQYKILAFLDKSNTETYNLNVKIAERGYEGLYYELFHGIDDEVPNEICDETFEILTMYRVINNLIETLSTDQKETLDLHLIRFEGFDPNNDKHYFFMKFIVRETGLFEEDDNIKFSSAAKGLLGKYKRMIDAYNKTYIANDNQLTLDGLKSIIDAV